ncbi:tetratricopeptide repeat protein [Dethiosulfatarculus sandiegensis]|uniref:tetratricopeptide repeat protein n=1 Tax=Dethiosulfatarculus sandiegensis TaxID=1429043 RepID=UPI0009EB7FF2
MLLFGKGIPVDLKQGFKWTQKAVKGENKTAQLNLGLWYLKGLGAQKDFEKAKYWLEKAADNGSKVALKYPKMLP